MLKSLRRPLFLGLVSLTLMLFFGAGFAPCLHVKSADCCQRGDDTSEPICDSGASCHCACAFFGIPLRATPPLFVPTLIDEIPIDTPIQTFFNLTGSLDRPPRFS